MTSDFKPKQLDPIADGYRKDPISEAYADAWEEGLWVKEFGAGPNGTWITAVGSIYALQLLEHENPELGDLNPQEFTLGDCVKLSLPGGGSTREGSVRDGIRAFKESQLWEQHEQWHREASDDD